MITTINEFRDYLNNQTPKRKWSELKKIKESFDDDDFDEDNEDDEEGEIDFSEIEWKMDKYMPEDGEIQDQYYAILDTVTPENAAEKIAELIEFFELNMIDSDRFESYLGPNRTIDEYCTYLVNKTNTNKLPPPPTNAPEPVI